MTVEIRGTIVSPDYDDEFFASYVNRGIITPSSRVVSAIGSATEPVDLYVNSYGGDVFAGGEMMIALRKALVSGKLRRCEVGSIAASMAANIVAALKADGADVVGHPNSQLMFHGCYTTTEGGAQHHEDVAESLRNINDGVVRDLNRIGISECRAWFAEGREKWMGADEAVKLGIFSGIEGEDADAPAEVKATATRLAAFASSITSRSEYSLMLDEEVKPEEAPVVAEVAESPEPEEFKVEEAVAEVKAEEMVPMARFAGLQAAKDKKISELQVELSARDASLAEANAKVSELLARAEKAEADLAETRAALEAESKAHADVVTSALAPAEKVKSYEEIMADRHSTPEERLAAAIAFAKKR